MSRVLQKFLREIIGPEGVPSDSRLLERFVAAKDQEAFAELVERHGPMVFGICRHLLRNTHDAEDAFQAAFLVLARKAASLRKRERVANWLFGVAYRSALEARRVNALRRSRETLMAHPPEIAVPDQAGNRNDLCTVLDEEVSRLPARYREVVVMCELEGRTRREAARMLAIPEGTLSSRLATARKMLAQRLARRGVVLSGGTLAASLIMAHPAPAVPTLLRLAAFKLGLAASASSSVTLSASVQLLTQGVIKAMFLHQFKVLGSLTLVMGLLAGGVGLLTIPSLGQQSPGSDNATRVEALPPPISLSTTSQAKKPPDVSRPDTKRPVEEAPNRAEETATRLTEEVNFGGYDDPKTTLAEILSELEQRFSIHFEIDERAFNEAMVKEVGLIFVAESPLPKMHQVPLLHVLNLILVRLDSKTGLENGVTFLIRDASIVITTVDAARRKILGNSDQPLPHLVTRNFENKRLDLALRELSKIGQGGYLNVVLDTRAAEQAKTPVSGFFNNAPLDTVVRLLADMANLTVVRLDNILYVTTPENAKKWGAAPGNLRPGPEPQKKAKVP